MSNLESLKIDFVRELRLRQWARQHFVPIESRKVTWHPVVLDEMSRRDHELINQPQQTVVDNDVARNDMPQSGTAFKQAARFSPHLPGSSFVPLEPMASWDIHLSSTAASDQDQVIQTIDSSLSTESPYLSQIL